MGCLVFVLLRWKIQQREKRDTPKIKISVVADLLDASFFESCERRKKSRMPRVHKATVKKTQSVM
jgi:hypothetical protein